MKKISTGVLLVLLILYWYGRFEVDSVDCSNEAGYCTYHIYNYNIFRIKCYINNDEMQLIKLLLKNCSSIDAEYTNLYVYKNYESITYGNLIIDLELASNINALYIYNIRDKDQFRLTTSSQNGGLTRLECHYTVQLESSDFFDYFTGLRRIETFETSLMISVEVPSFTNLQSLYFLKARLVGLGLVTHTFDNKIISGLSNLRVVDLSYSYFNSITERAFDNVTKLTFLSFHFNKISIVAEGAFSQLTRLRSLTLSYNGIKTVSKNIFNASTGLTFLKLGGNPGFPIQSLLNTRSLVSLHLQNNKYRTLDPYIFQLMKSLTILSIKDPFICDCKLRWMSVVSQYRISINIDALCTEPIEFLQKSITDPKLYTNCTQTESYQCFDKSITCPSSQICLNSEDSYFCSCPIGYSQLSSGVCLDEDECAQGTDCQHYCVNTEGSYYCACEEGYRLTSNGYNCDDINECQEWIDGCEFGCGNIIGSYQCYCEVGHQLHNKTHCESEIRCDILDIGGYQDNIFTCQEGFNLTITNLTCLDITAATSTTLATTTTATNMDINTGTATTTNCPNGYSLHSSNQCIDIDECAQETNCQYSCENTDGSYYCACTEGYEIATNGYDCIDVNECQEGNGRCEYGCRNTIGSYQCYCEDGHLLYNKTQCEEGITCELVENSCINDMENTYKCKGGFDIFLFNFSCSNGNSQVKIPPNETTLQPRESTTPLKSSTLSTFKNSGWTIPTIVLVFISLALNFFLIFVIITLSIYLIRRIHIVQYSRKSEGTKEQIQQNFYNDESLYSPIVKLENTDNLEESPASETESKLKKISNYMVSQSYPGRMQDETSGYMSM
ncbi:Fibrillin-3 isoform X2 [Oopsacas minuta]|uniref:Fibrillin-3 isoform X2 n=1 Tax=Oopsacas minuta TaxID=111878 RepID=A0AAV7KIX1_9METZ|nr:Fibrillin-3 isoform X2 [Oopsacas minuta]